MTATTVDRCACGHLAVEHRSARTSWPHPVHYGTCLASGCDCRQMSAGCAGCGEPLAPNKASGPKRKWCSEKCRRAQYSQPCADCGAPTNGSSGHGPRAPRVCGGCHKERQGAVMRERGHEDALRMLELSRQGLLNVEIAERLGRPSSSVSRSLGRLRAAGESVPSNYHKRGTA